MPGSHRPRWPENAGASITSARKILTWDGSPEPSGRLRRAVPRNQLPCRGNRCGGAGRAASGTAPPTATNHGDVVSLLVLDERLLRMGQRATGLGTPQDDLLDSP